MVAHLDVHGGSLDIRMVVETSAGQFPVPRPVVLGGRRRVHAEPRASGRQVADEFVLPGIGQDVSASGEEDHRGVVTKVGQVTLGVVDVETQALHGLHTGRYRFVPVPGCPGVNEQSSHGYPY
jgi:hypothetical protein